MLEFGIPNSCIKTCAKTGLIVDIEGLDSEVSKPVKKTDLDPVNCIALRADLDGLPMPENNEGLPYRTITNYAHMCGHDGHMATLITTAKCIWQLRSKMSTKHKVRLLF